jgi:hypothetical protein
VITRSTLVFAGAAIWAVAAAAFAQTSVYSDNFETGTLADRTQWDFNGVNTGTSTLLSTTPLSPLTATTFLAEFGGNDVARLNLDLPEQTAFVRLTFDAYLLRTWDGFDPNFGGPDTFGYGVEGQTPLLNATFSNGFGQQSHCPGAASNPCIPARASEANLQHKLGFVVELDPDPRFDKPAKGDPMSMVYHFDSGPIAYSGSSITFNFFSQGLQSLVDESWGLDNIDVIATLVPEPGTTSLLTAGLLTAGLLAFSRGRKKA